MRFASIVFAITSAYIVCVAASPTPNIITCNTDAEAFGINMGDNATDTVAWVAGESQCYHVVLGLYVFCCFNADKHPDTYIGTDPCNRPFHILGEGPFTWQGCGTYAGWIKKGKTFWANCGLLIEVDTCSVRSEFHCQ